MNRNTVLMLGLAAVTAAPAFAQTVQIRIENLQEPGGMTRTLAGSDRFEATADFGRLAEADVIIVCLPTPLGKHHEPDLSYVVIAGEQIGRTLRAGQLIALESTTYPGTTRGEFLEAIEREAEKRGIKLECGKDYFVAYSPEREDPGRQSHTTSTIPKLVGGLDDTATDLAMQMYAKGIDNLHRVDSAEIAEAAKLLENIFRAVNIAMVNEMKLILTRMGIDVWKVIEAASTKPFGFMPIAPSAGGRSSMRPPGLPVMRAPPTSCCCPAA